MPLSFTDEQIHAKAVQLGLIDDGQELPRQLRSKVLAALAQDGRPAKEQPTGPKLAKEITIQPNGAILVDGEPFPWLVVRAPMDIRLDPDEFSTVRLTLMANAVQILKPAAPESENRA